MMLPLVFCEYAEVDGVARALVVAAEAASAVLVFPADAVVGGNGDVAQWAGTDTMLAVDAMAVGVEVAVGDEEAVEEWAEYVGLNPGHRSSAHVGSLFSFVDAVGDGWQAVLGRLHLGFGLVGRVGVEAWQTNVGVGHVDRKDCIHLSAQQVVEDGVGISDVIAAGDDRPYILGSFDVLHVCVKIFLDHFGNAPSIDRKNHAEHVRFVLKQSLELVCNPLAVACARKTVEHL